MLTVYVRASDDRLEIGRGELRAQFEREGNRWVPLWIRLGDRRMCRFKDHRWLALGSSRPLASDWEILRDTAARAAVRFAGEEPLGGASIEWSVTLEVEDALPGLTVTTEFRPSRTIPLIECFSTLETPGEYDGREEVICMIGQNPLVWQRGEHLLTPLPDRCHAVFGSTEQWIARTLDSTRSPIACLGIKSPSCGEDRYFTLLGHWDQSTFRRISVLPGPNEENRYAYEIRAGTLDWLSAPQTTVFFEAETTYRQRMTLTVSSEMPGGSPDRWFYGAFERSLIQFFPAELQLESETRARRKGATLAEANHWLIESFSGRGTPGFYLPGRGVVEYIPGTFPNLSAYSPCGLPAWLAAFGYQAYITRNETINPICDSLAQQIARALEDHESIPCPGGPVFHQILPLLRYLMCYPDDALGGVVRRALGRLLEAYPPDSGLLPDLDSGSEAIHACAFLLAGQIGGDRSLRKAGMVSLERTNKAAVEAFWRFGCSRGWSDAAAGAQARPIGYGHGILANLLAYQQTREERFVESAGTLARLLVSICFATFNDSADPDLDVRGFANGAIAGSDRLIECSPLESAVSLAAIAYWLGFRSDRPVGYYDLLWYHSRTFCGAFPKARERKAGRAPDDRPHALRQEDLPGGTPDRQFPNIAYENPVAQIRQSSRASVETLMSYLTFGGGLASCNNERLLVLVPRAAGYDLSERISRTVHVYNPGSVVEQTAVAIHHLPDRAYEIILNGKRVAKDFGVEDLKELPLEVQPRRNAVLEVQPARQPSTYF